jgi:hypothetical protein
LPLAPFDPACGDGDAHRYGVAVLTHRSSHFRV